jgi:hypothetical protein
MLQATENQLGDLPTLKETVLQKQVKASSLVRRIVLQKRSLTKKEIQKGLRIKELQKVDFLKIRKQALREDLPSEKSLPIGKRKKRMEILPIALKRRNEEKEKNLEENSKSPVLVQSVGINPDLRKGRIQSPHLSQRIEEVEKIFRRIKLRLLQVKSASTKEEERTKSPFMGWNLSHSMGMRLQRKEDLERIEASL